MQKNKPHILHIYPGYIFDSEALHRHKYEHLSKYYSGDILSISDKHQEHLFGSFKTYLFEPKRSAAWWIFIELFYNAIKLMKAQKYDLVVCYDPLRTGLIAAILKIFFRYKLIIEVNGTYHAKELYKNRGKIAALKGQIYPKIQKLSLQSADAIKCLYPGQIDALKLEKNTHTFFDYTKIESRHFERAPTKTILTIGFPVHIKGIDLLIEAFRRASTSEPDWKLKLVGHFRADMDELTKITRNIDNIEICKPVPFHEIPALIDQCEIFALASRSEAMGRVLLEAMARSKARIASNVGGIPTVVDDGVDGLLFETENTGDLTEKLLLLMRDIKLREQLAKEGNARFLRDFSIDAYVANTQRLYGSVL